MSGARAIMVRRVTPTRIAAGAALLLALVAAGAVAGPVPASPDAPKVGTKAPNFSLPDAHGDTQTLAGLGRGADGARRWVLLVFYRGFW